MMPAELPSYVVERLRRSVPIDACIVPSSTPVLAFGNPRKARIATLGLNPSRVEFLSKDGRELEGNQRRLETLTSLKIETLANASAEALAAVVAGCDSYFNKNPYGNWFNQLEIVLNACSASYYDGSACHLDLVQWATDPTWSGLPKHTREMLISADAPFLEEQLRNENISLLILNGMTAVRQFSKNLDIKLAEHSDGVMGNTRMFIGTGPREMRIIGWNWNFQSSFGISNELRRAIAAAVAALSRRDRDILT